MPPDSPNLMPDFEPNAKHESARDEHDKFALENWKKIPADIRRQVMVYVQPLIPVAMMNTWRDQYARGMRIGSDYVLFHHDVGMQIRNACRKILLDDQLPFVKYDDGNEYQNWDDFYGGMLQQLASETY